MADMSLVMDDYKKGMSVEQLKIKYKLNDKDLETLNKNIQKELGVKDRTLLLPGSTEITLEDGTKVLAAKIRTVNQPKGGFVNVYLSQDGKQYYQYTDANGKQEKISSFWNYESATWDNLKVAWDKMQDGHPLDALMTLMEGAEDPRGYNTGVAPAGVLAGKGVGFLKSMKDFGKWSKQLKNIKTFEQFKSFAKSFIQKMKPAKQMKPSKNLCSRVDWAQCTAMGRKDVIAEALRFGNATESTQGTVLNAENTAKICQNLTKTLGKKINPKDLKVAHFQDDTKIFSRILYYDDVTGRSYCFMQDGAPGVVIEYKYSITGKIKNYDYVGSWVDGKWE